MPRGMHQEARTKCKQLARAMEKHGVDIDFLKPTFERYCKHQQTAFMAYLSIKKDGIIIETKNKKGKVVSRSKHPACQIFKDNSVAAMKYEQHFYRIMKDTARPDDEKHSELIKFMSKSARIGNMA